MPEPRPEPAETAPLEALLWVPPGFDAEAGLAGLPLCLRHVLALQQAGATRIWLRGAATRPADARVTVPIETTGVPATAALVARADTTYHRELASRLAAQHAGRGLVRAGESDGLWWVPEGGAGALLTALEGGATPPCDAALELHGDEFVLPVRDAAERAAAYRAHLNSLIKPTSGLMEKLYMRPISKHLTRLFVPTPVTPNQMSLVTLGLALYAAYLVAQPGHGPLVWGGLLHIWMRVVDCVDGELARLRYQASRFGQWLDSVGDGIGMAAFVAAATVHVARDAPDLAPIGIAGVLAWCLVQAMQYTTALGGGGDGNFQHIEWGHRSRNPSAFERLVGKLELLLRIDVISTLYGVLAMADMLRALLWIHLAVSVPAAVYFTTQALKLRRARTR